MKHTEWKDDTAYAQNDTLREPRRWMLEHGDARVFVFRGRDCWIVTCPDIYRFEKQQLKSANVDEAKVEALSVVTDCLRRLVQDFAEIGVIL